MADTSIAWLSALRAHELRRPVSKQERATIHAGVSRAFLQRALLQRRSAARHPRWAALKDVLRACRYSPGTTLLSWRLGVALAAVLAPRSFLNRATAVGHELGVVVI